MGMAQFGQFSVGIVAGYPAEYCWAVNHRRRNDELTTTIVYRVHCDEAVAMNSELLRNAAAAACGVGEALARS